jgi:hypothetical protein
MSESVGLIQPADRAFLSSIPSTQIKGAIVKTLLWSLYRFLGRLSGAAGKWQMRVIFILDQLDQDYAGTKWAKKLK